MAGAGPFAGRRALSKEVLDVSLTAPALLQELKRAQIDVVVSVPDSMTKGLYAALSVDKEVRLLPVAREEEGMGLCTGLYLVGRRPALLIQNTGVFAAVNALRGLGLGYRVPVLLLVGLLGREPGVPLPDSANPLVRLTGPQLDLLKIPHDLLEDNAQVGLISQATQEAWSEGRPHAILIGEQVA